MLLAAAAFAVGASLAALSIAAAPSISPAAPAPRGLNAHLLSRTQTFVASGDHLVTDLADNPLQMSVDVDAPEPQRDGTYVVPILVKVPISMLALLPEATRHVGKLHLVVQAQSAEGNLSPPVRGEVPIEIDNAEIDDQVLLTATRVGG